MFFLFAVRNGRRDISLGFFFLLFFFLLSVLGVTFRLLLFGAVCGILFGLVILFDLLFLADSFILHFQLELTEL